MSRCEVCFRHCELKEGAAGFCGARICRDGKVIGFTTEPSYTLNDLEGHFTVRAANEMGGLSDASEEVSDPTGIQEISNNDSCISSVTYYNADGMRVSAKSKGILIKVTTLKDGRRLSTKIVK